MAGMVILYFPKLLQGILVAVESTVTSISIKLISILLLIIGFCFKGLANRQCYDVHNPVYTYSNLNIDQPLDLKVSNTLSSIGVRPDLFSEVEKRLRFPDQKNRNFDLSIKAAVDSKLKEGLLLEPDQKGTVVLPTSSKLSAKKSVELYKKLKDQTAGSGDDKNLTKGTGDLALFADEALQSRLKEKGLNLGEPDRNGHVRIDDAVMLDQFMQEIPKSVNLTLKEINYILTIYEEIINTARIVMKPRDKKLIGLRLRWKSEGRGSDFDTFHTDRLVFAASTLAVVGLGTEVIHQNSQGIDLLVAGTDKVSHILGNQSNYPVLHRSSTEGGNRLVFLIFWN